MAFRYSPGIIHSDRYEADISRISENASSPSKSLSSITTDGGPPPPTPAEGLCLCLCCCCCSCCCRAAMDWARVGPLDTAAEPDGVALRPSAWGAALIPGARGKSSVTAASGAAGGDGDRVDEEGWVPVALAAPPACFGVCFPPPLSPVPAAAAAAAAFCLFLLAAFLSTLSFMFPIPATRPRPPPPPPPPVVVGSEGGIG